MASGAVDSSEGDKERHLRLGMARLRDCGDYATVDGRRFGAYIE